MDAIYRCGSSGSVCRYAAKGCLARRFPQTALGLCFVAVDNRCAAFEVDANSGHPVALYDISAAILDSYEYGFTGLKHDTQIRQRLKFQRGSPPLRRYT